MKWFDKKFSAFENVLVWIAAAALLLMVAMMVGDALGRYLLNGGIPGTYRMVEMFLYPTILFLSWPYAQRAGRNVAVDFVRQRAKGGVKRAIETVIYSVSLALIVVLTYGAFNAAVSEWGKWTVEFPPLPVGISRAILVFGGAALSIRLILQLISVFRLKDADEQEPSFAPPESSSTAESDSWGSKHPGKWIDRTTGEETA